jgi:hypothetical protein
MVAAVMYVPESRGQPAFIYKYSVFFVHFTNMEIHVSPLATPQAIQCYREMVWGCFRLVAQMPTDHA